MQSESLKTLKGNNHWRIIFIVFLLIISIACFLLIETLSFVIVMLGIYSLSITAFIRFPRIEIGENQFDFIQSSFIQKLNKKKTYKYKDLKYVEFSKGYYNWLNILLLSITNSKSTQIRSGQDAKSDSMKIVKMNNDRIDISRIGSKESFKEAINLINKKILNE